VCHFLLFLIPLCFIALHIYIIINLLYFINLCPFITSITVELLKGSKSVNFRLFMRYSCLFTSNTCFTYFWYITIRFHIHSINSFSRLETDCFLYAPILSAIFNCCSYSQQSKPHSHLLPLQSYSIYTNFIFYL
jgi:hypothetical protein